MQLGCANLNIQNGDPGQWALYSPVRCSSEILFYSDLNDVYL